MLMGFSFWHCICISQIVDLFVDISSLRIHVLVTSHQLLFEITVKFIKYTNFFRTKLHYTISTKIFKNLTVLYCLQSLRKENLKRSDIHNVHGAFFDIPDESNTLMKEFHMIHV